MNLYFIAKFAIVQRGSVRYTIGSKNVFKLSLQWRRSIPNGKTKNEPSSSTSRRRHSTLSFHVVVLQTTARNVQRFITYVHSYCFAQFCDVFVAVVVVVVCLCSLTLTRAPETIVLSSFSETSQKRNFFFVGGALCPAINIHRSAFVTFLFDNLLRIYITDICIFCFILKYVLQT